MWDLQEGVCVKTFGIKFAGIISIKVLTEETFVCSSYNNIQIHNLYDGSYVKSLHGHQKPINQIHVVSSETIVSCSKDRTIKVIGKDVRF